MNLRKIETEQNTSILGKYFKTIVKTDPTTKIKSISVRVIGHSIGHSKHIPTLVLSRMFEALDIRARVSVSDTFTVLIIGKYCKTTTKVYKRCTDIANKNNIPIIHEMDLYKEVIDNAEDIYGDITKMVHSSMESWFIIRKDLATKEIKENMTKHINYIIDVVSNG